MFLTTSAINCCKTHSFTLPQAESMGSFVGKTTLDMIGACAGIWIISIGHLSFYGYVSALGAAISFGFLADGGYGLVRQCIKLCSSKKISQNFENENGMNADVVYFARQAFTDEVTRSYISEVVNSDCPFWGGYKVAETSTMIYIPEKIDAKSYSLKALLQWLKQNFEVLYDQDSFNQWVMPMRDEEYSSAPYFILILKKYWIQGNEEQRQRVLTPIRKNEELKISEAGYPSLREAVFHLAGRYLNLKESNIPMLWCSETAEPQGQEGKRLRLAVGFKEECGIYFGAFPMDETNDKIEFHPVRKIIRNL